MSNVVNRTTKEYKRSVHAPDYPNQDWIHNPDLSAVVGFQSKHWVINGEDVSLMSQAERDAVDAAELELRRDAEASILDNMEHVSRAVLLVILDEFNNHANKHNAIIAATGANVSNYPSRTVANLRNAVRGKLGS